MNQDDMFHPEIVVGYYEGNILDAFVLRNIAHIYIYSIQICLYSYCIFTNAGTM